MKRLIPCLAALGFAATLTAATLDTSAYAKSLVITVPATAVAADVELADVPLLVRLSAGTGGTFDYADVKQANGGDLAFADADGNSLAYDVDTWNADGESLVWVRVPTFRRGTRIVMWYGAESATDNTPSAVWSGRYAGVWHCADASGNLTDATGHDLAAVPTVADAGSAGYLDKMVAEEDGAVGLCRAAQDSSSYFSGMKSTHLVADAEALHVGSQFVFSGWYKANQVIAYTRLVSAKADYNQSTGWEVQFNDNPRRVSLRGAGEVDLPVSVPSCVGRWTHFTFAFDGATARCYTNGFLAASGTVRTVADSANGLAFGGNTTAKEAGLYGWFDELRYRSGAVSAAEIEAEYRMVAEADYLTYGDGTVDASQFAKAVMFTLNASYADDAVTDAPVLVRLSTAIDGFSYSNFQDAAGGDLCVTDVNGAILPHEIDTWNPSGESLIWVKMPSAAKGTRLVLYYGSATYRAANSAATWSDYVGVWHFGEESGTAYDATGHGLDGTPTGNYAEGHNRGIDGGVIGRARKNGGNGEYANKSYISVPDYDTFGLTDTFTASGFFRVSGKGGWYRLFSRKSNAAPDGGWGQELNYNDLTMLYVYGSAANQSMTIPSLDKTWVHLTFVYEGERCTVYANGEKVGETTGTFPRATANGLPLSFGCTSDGADWPLCGDYDEIRLTGRIPTAEQVKFEYAAMTATDVFTAGRVIATADGMPSVSVEKVRDAVESRRVGGIFRIALDKAVAWPVRVAYAISGTAQSGVDYSNAATESVLIPAGKTSVDVEIAIKYNPKATADRTVELTLVAGEGYSIGTASSAALTIADLAAPTKHCFRKMLDLTVPAEFLGEETLAGFPVLVRLSSAISGFDYADFKSTDGSDILFTDAKGVQAYAHEVDEWNVGGESLVWVFLPELKAGTTLRMYYGSEMDLGGADAGAVWPGYAGVWHFNERTWKLPARDATGHGLDAVVKAQFYPSYNTDFPEGAVGHARYNMPVTYDAGGRNWYSVPAYDDLEVGPTFVVSGWFRANDKMLGYPRILSRKSSYDGKTGWEAELANSFTSLNVRGASAGSLSVELPSLENNWVHMAFAFVEGTDKSYRVKAYVNGTLAAESGSMISPPQDNGLPLSFGNNAVGNEASFNGAFDEIRLRSGEASANWMRAEYETARDAVFVEVGAVQSAVGGFKLIIR